MREADPNWRQHVNDYGVVEFIAKNMVEAVVRESKYLHCDDDKRNVNESVLVKEYWETECFPLDMYYFESDDSVMTQAEAFAKWMCNNTMMTIQGCWIHWHNMRPQVIRRFRRRNNTNATL